MPLFLKCLLYNHHILNIVLATLRVRKENRAVPAFDQMYFYFLEVYFKVIWKLRFPSTTSSTLVNINLLLLKCSFFECV